MSETTAARKVLITGGGRGLGAATARILANAGAELWLASRTRAELNATVGSCGGAEVVRATAVDVTDAAAVEAFAQEVEDVWDRLDVLINNAGVWLEGPVSSNTPESIERVLLTNLLGPILTTRAFLPLLKRGVNSQILNVGSLAGVEPGPDWPVYAATKYGLRGFSDSLAVEMENAGIRVTLISPGGIDTDLYKVAGYPDKVHQPWMMPVDSVAGLIAPITMMKPEVRTSQLEIRNNFAS